MKNSGGGETDLHGSAPDSSPVALLLVDVINDMDFDDGDQLARRALPRARAFADLKRRAADLGIPAIYVNDNFGRWRSDFQRTVEHVRREGSRGREIAELLHPAERDYFVLKPKNSGFFSTTLDTLLEHLGARTLIIGGFSAHVCVLFTANDAHMRDYRVIVPADCVASPTEEMERASLALMRDAAGADTTPSTEIDLQALLASDDGGSGR